MRFVELGEYLCEVRAKQYWRLENLKSFDEFLEKRFTDSRRKAYCLMTILKVARRDGEEFALCTWVHKAKELPRKEFKRKVERHLTGKETLST